MAKKGLYANIHAKKKRIAAGSGERMRKKGAKVLLLINSLKKLQKQLKKEELKKGNNYV